MADSNEESDLLSEAHETESDSEDEASAGKKGKTPRLIPASASARYAAKIRQVGLRVSRSRQRFLLSLDELYALVQLGLDHQEAVQ